MFDRRPPSFMESDTEEICSISRRQIPHNSFSAQTKRPPGNEGGLFFKGE